MKPNTPNMISIPWAGFETFLTQEWDRMTAIARKITGNDADADDVVIQAAALAMTKMSVVAAPARRQWLRRVVINEALQMLQRNSRYERYETSFEGLEESGYEVASTRENPEQLLLRRELRLKMDSVVSRLPRRLRPVFNLRLVDGAAGREAADELKLTEACVKSHTFRARRFLQKRLRQEVCAL